MINRLRRKFIAITMISVLAVLLIIMGAVNYMNYSNIVSDADSTLRMIADNGGTFPKRGPKGAESPDNENGAQPKLPESEEGSGNGSSGDINERRNIERPFDTRYFTATFDGEGSLKKTELGRIAAVSEDEAKEYAEDVYKSGKEKGFVDSYRYLRSKQDGGTLIIFVDCYRGINNFRSFLFYSVLVSLAGYIAVFILVVLLSGRAVRPVAESYEKQKRFITDAGHELKTPLSVIDADVKVMEMESGKSEWLDDIKAQTSRLSDLTGELVYLTKMDEGRELSKIEFPISDVISEQVKSFEGRAKAEGKEFTYDISEGLSFTGDQKMIQELMSVLLDNAFKYSDGRGPIRAGLEQTSKGVRISVENTVTGLGKEKVDRLFDRFYRADEARSSETPGYGLGLSIAKAVCQAHSGDIKASLSEDGTIAFICELCG